MTTPPARRLRPARLNPADLARLGVAGLRARPLRVFLSALGIAIGIAAMLSVVGVTTSSRAHLDRTLQRLGTNLLTVVPGEAGDGRPESLPEESVGMVGRIGPVEKVSATGKVAAAIYRNDHVPAPETSSVEVLAAESGLLDTLGVTVAEGSWFTPATATYPAVVLGAVAARRLDVPAPGMRLWLSGEWFVVVGILESAPLVPALDSAALVGWDAARTYLDFDGRPTVVYVRADEQQVTAVRDVLGRTTDPQSPQHVRVSRPSDALAAKQAADATLSGTLLGLGMVALLVGGVGIANTMVISVLERRAEIGLRRALGATRGQIRVQFLAESLLLSGLGGAGGVVMGTVAAGLYASSQHWPVFVPGWATGGSLAAALLIGALAGLYPAVRASRLEPTSALGG
ncbi:ABC transporter permease [Catellatospora citrea]|uniref:ABC transporter permease n=1 Tax=Catellatospora citrea TaxID=53366 RepID=UPI0033E07C75